MRLIANNRELTHGNHPINLAIKYFNRLTALGIFGLLMYNSNSDVIIFNNIYKYYYNFYNCSTTPTIITVYLKIK